MRGMLFVLAILATLTPLGLSAQDLQAVVKELSGKVEVKQPGQDWQPVELNMAIPKGATISTGFNSRLVLALGQTQVVVRPLTRMALRELIKKETTNTTSLALRVGKLNVSVKSVSGESNVFTVRGPSATAAVRGTEFDFDVNLDDRVTVLDGFVAVTAGVTGHTWTVLSGQTLDTNGVSSSSVRPFVTPPQNDLLGGALQNEGDFAQGGFNEGLGLNRLPTSHSSSSTVTITVN